MLHSPEWKQGDTAQQRWAEKMRARGLCVLPTYAFEDVTKETKAPVMLIPDRVLVTPDMLTLGRKAVEPVVWHEVKSKSAPTWHRNKERWEHGFDYDLVSEYDTVQTESMCPVWIIVQELSTPSDPSTESALVAAEVWLYARLATCIEYGEHREDWPGGRFKPWSRGRKGRGGLLWPRSIMKQLPTVTA